MTNKNLEIYDKVYNELNFDEAMKLYQEENDSREYVDSLLSEWSDIILFEKNELDLNENMANEYNALGKNEIKRKIKNLKRVNSFNEYFYSEKIIEKNNKKTLIIPYITEYAAITFDQILRDNKFLFNINLPYRKIKDIMQNIITFTKVNKKILTQYDEKNSFLFHSNFIKKINELIKENIQHIFNDGVCAKFIHTIIIETGMEHYMEINLNDLLNKNENKKEEIIRCLIIMGLSINTIWPNEILEKKYE